VERAGEDGSAPNRTPIRSTTIIPAIVFQEADTSRRMGRAAVQKRDARPLNTPTSNRG
jgi:hypothetical protein